jgi:prevent-host-death family protein
MNIHWALSQLDQSFGPLKLTNLTKLELDMSIYNVYEAKTHLSDLIERAAAGEEIIIAKAGKAKVRLVPVAGPKAVREPGGSEGRIHYGPDWDAPMSQAELNDWEAGE